ncbi:ESX secretion-associated protein EspG [Nocardia transvalensis]|uniref:ESX secretion-associated protein EspG n=1 Tax=Nocardia transvalensis TaxID=37333 RepID=UPI001895A4A2|nr:ESX secretion-associated protein EspG [Nocardia transvalensis]MBF6332343.1 ESX secretion-associated protein EspG [Nocardia transvalensis]
MRTQTVWDFTPDEFAWVWAETGLAGEYPYPISILETPAPPDEYARRRAEISARYPHRGDPDLTWPLRVLVKPDLRLICTGKFHDSVKRVRSLAAAHADLGVILFQKSGPSADFGGDIKLVVAQRRNLGRHLAATMPPAQPGAAGQMVGYTPRVRGEQPPASWRPDDEGRRPVEERIRLLLRAPRVAEGHLCIERYLHSRNPSPPVYLNWIDIRDNHSAGGRYLIAVDDNDTVVTPATEEVIARELHRRAALHHL